MSGRWQSSFARVLLAGLLMLICCAGFGQGSRVSASVQPAQVTVGDSATDTITVEITGADTPRITLPSIDPNSGLSAPSPAGQQSNITSQIVNGRFRSLQQVIYSYTIRTSKEGTFTIPSASVSLNGRTYETQPVQLRVLGVPKAVNAPAELDGLIAPPDVPSNPELKRKLTGGIFVLPVLTKTDPYNGEQVRISYHLVIDPNALQQADLQSRTTLDGVKVPEMNDFISDELFPFPQDLKFQERKIGGKLYYVAPVYEAVISSTKSGKLTIEPFQISMFFNQRGQQRQLPAPFANDPFFSSMAPLGIMGGSSVQVIAQSPPLTLDVKPVPDAGKPADFSGAVGKFTIGATVDKTNARAYDDTVALTVTVQGLGNAESLSPPRLPQMSAFTVLGDPDVKTEGHKDDDKYISSKTFTYTLRPTTPGNQSIPPISLSYFDPEKKEYERAETDALPLIIAPGTHPAPQAAPPASSSETPEQQPQTAPEVDLRYISTKQLQSPGGGLAWIWGPLGILLFLAPPSLLTAASAAAALRARREQRQVDPARLAKTAANQHLKSAEHALHAKDIREMAAQLAEAIRLHFAAEFHTSPGAVTIPLIEERLRSAGSPADEIAHITQLLEECDSVQYAPASSNAADAQRLYSSAANILHKPGGYA